MVTIASSTGRKKNRNGVMSFTKWKQEAVEKLLSDEKLMKLLYYEESDCLEKPNLSEEQKESLVHSQIYTYRYVEELSQNKRSYISMGMSNFVPQESFRHFSDDYLQGYIYFYILVDRSIIQTDTGCRNDLILSRVYELFQEKRMFGMGELRMEACVELWEQQIGYGGYTVGFRIVDFK